MVQLGLPVLGVISDAQISERLAVAQLWPTVPHQICQFHYLREASRPMFDLDRQTRTAMRKTIQSKLRETRSQVTHHLQDLDRASAPEQQAEREQLQILADYALGMQTALSLDGIQPFVYPGLAGYEALGAIEDSLINVEKRADTESPRPDETGSAQSPGGAAAALEPRDRRAAPDAGWLVKTEQILAGQWCAPGEQLTNTTVAERFDSRCTRLVHLPATEPLSETKRHCLTHFTQGLRPQLIQCYDRAAERSKRATGG